MVTDTAANMKRAFRVVKGNETENDVNIETESLDSESDSENEGDSHDNDGNMDSHVTDELGGLCYWSSAVSLSQFEGWIGCAAHQLQLVVYDGYKELQSYRRVQSAFSKCKAISKQAHQSSHFKYALSRQIPVANDTRWYSHHQLHCHILK